MLFRSIGLIFGETLSLVFDTYGRLGLDENLTSIIPLVEPIEIWIITTPHHTLADASPWPSSEPSTSSLLS